VWTSEASSSPGAIVGPREYRPSGGTGAVATGDIDDDGHDEVVVAQRDAARLDILAPDYYTGISEAAGPGQQTIAATAALVAVADVLPDPSGRPEIAVINAPSGELRLYRLVGSTLTLVAGPFVTGNGPSGIACGDVDGSSSADIVVTAASDDAFRVYSESGGTLVIAGPFATGPGPRGPSIGQVLDGTTANGIVVVNGGQSGGAATVSIFKADGIRLADYGTTPASLAPRVSLVADVLPGSTGAEIVVALDGAPDSDGYVDVFARASTTGYAAPQTIIQGRGYHPSALASGDVDGDGRPELVVANQGLWLPAGQGQTASIQVMESDPAGTALEPTATRTYWAGGLELSGGAPSLSVADLGPFGPSRHPMDTARTSHVSTEVATSGTPLPRHVVCSDCHDPHTATSAPATAPAAMGPIVGSWGVSVTNTSKTDVAFTERRGVVDEYELCLKCHSGWADLRGGADLALEINPLNASVHAVEQSSTTAQVPDETWAVSGLSNSTVLHCTDCHGDSATSQARGPHRSASAPLLVKPLLGIRADDSQGLCFSCHLNTVYTQGVGPASRFSNGATSLHAKHVGSSGFACDACHARHGSADNPALVRSDIGFASSPTGGSCANSCHPSGASRAYTR
jgi:hypothetical protein